MRNPFILLESCKLSVLPRGQGKSSFRESELWWDLASQILHVSRSSGFACQPANREVAHATHFHIFDFFTRVSGTFSEHQGSGHFGARRYASSLHARRAKFFLSHRRYW